MTTEYITAVSLEPYFVDKDTGVPLAGGYVQFWEDADRTVPKLVYQKQNVGADPVTGQPVYQFVPLPNPLVLSGVGTFQDSSGNNIAVYYYPFDADGNLQLYYIAVFNSLGVPQFTREGWPGSTGNDGPINTTGGAFANCILNSQFVQVAFDPNSGLTHSYSGSGTATVAVAPGWNLVIDYTGSGSVTINRLSVAGSSNFLTNPPYILSIVPGANLSSMALVQTLTNNPGIWTPQNAGVNGYVASYILLGANTSATITYAPNIGASTTLLMANNLSSVYQGYANTVQLPPSANTDNADTGYVNISIALSTTTTSLLSSIQVLGLDDNIQDIDYVQTPANIQNALINASQEQIGTTVKISTIVANNSPSIDFTNLSDIYSSFEIKFYGVYVSANDNLMFLTSSNNGASYDNSAGDYRWAETGQIDSSSYFPSDASGNTFIAFTDSFTGYKLTTNANQPICGTIEILDPSAALPTQMIFNTGGIFYLNSGNIWAGNFFSVGTRTAAVAVNAVQIAPYLNTTTIVAGTFELYGTI